MHNRKKLLLQLIFEAFTGKNDLFIKEKRLLKLMIFNKMAFKSFKFHETNKFPAVKYTIVGNYSPQKASLRDDRI